MPRDLEFAVFAALLNQHIDQFLQHCLQSVLCKATMTGDRKGHVQEKTGIVCQ